MGVTRFIRRAFAITGAVVLLCGSAVVAAPVGPATASAQAADDSEILHVKDAQVAVTGPVTTYSWESSVSGSQKKWITDPLPGSVVNGGIRLHEFAAVFITDTYPASENQWKVAVQNQQYAEVKVTVYAMVVTQPRSTANRPQQASTADAATATADEGVLLPLEEAHVSTTGTITIYRWDEKVATNDHARWITPELPDPVVSGGLQVHGWKFVVMTDNYPAAERQWKVAVENFDTDTAVTVYALTMKDASVSIFDSEDSIHGFQDKKLWTMKVPYGTVVGGGISVHGWHDVRMTNSYPASANQWAIGSESFSTLKVGVTLYSIAVPE